MLVKTEGRFLTDYYGSAPAIGTAGVLEKWIEDKQCDWLLSWGEQIKKKGQDAMKALEDILSIFHRDKDGNPILGNWMFRRCLVKTGEAIFNAQKDKTHPKRKVIPMAISIVEPININIHNGSLVKEPDNIKTYTVSLENGRSFFKAYESINADTTFKAEITFDDELLTKEHIRMILDKCGMIGVGAFRERYGKFKLDYELV